MNDNNKFNLGTWRIVPTISKNNFGMQAYYKHNERIEAGMPTFPEPEEPAEFDCTQALDIIANIKAKL